MGQYTWILDPGHGGLGPGGEYLTPGKRSPEVPPGIFEGEFNRDIARRVVELCDGLDMTITNPGPVNAGLLARVNYARGLQKVRKNCVFISIHANAAGNGKRWRNDAQGVVVFHHKWDAKGKVLAKWMIESFQVHTGIDVTRGIKTAMFSVLTGTRMMPSILIECDFMTHEERAKFLASPEGREKIAYAIARIIHQMEQTGEL